jgi:hypothetical protein
MSHFLRQCLHLDAVDVPGVEADLFALPDGSRFAVALPGGMGDTSRSIGFLTDDLDDALSELAKAGISTGSPSENAESRYAHFRAPDGQLYELVEHKRPPQPDC